MPIINNWLAGSGGSPGIQYVGGQVATRATIGTWTINYALTGGLDSAPQAGDYVIIAQQIDSTVNRDIVCSTPGFSELEDRYLNGGHDLNFAVHTKIMGGTPDTSVSFSGPSVTDPKALAISVWRGVDQTTPQDVARQYAENVNSGTPDAPSITPVTPGAKIIVIGASGVVNTSATPLSSSLDNFIQTQQANGVFMSKIGIGKADWAGGPYNPAAWSTDSGTWGALTMALRPA